MNCNLLRNLIWSKPDEEPECTANLGRLLTFPYDVVDSGSLLLSKLDDFYRNEKRAPSFDEVFLFSWTNLKEQQAQEIGQLVSGAALQSLGSFGLLLRQHLDQRKLMKAASLLNDISHTLSTDPNPMAKAREQISELNATFATASGAKSTSIQDEMAEILGDAQKATVQKGILSGFVKLDNLTNGGQKGELWVVGGYTGEGKSQTVINMAYYAAFYQKKRVIVFSAEMPKKQYRNRLISRHSRHPKFNLPDGLPYVIVKNPNNPQYFQQFEQIVQDFCSPNYGSLTIVQVPHNYTVANVRDELASYPVGQHPEAVFVDYAGILSAARKRSNHREEVDEILKDLKQLSLDANGGEGVFICTPWQMTQEARERAEKTGTYTLRDFADTSGLTRTADCIITILRRKVEVVEHEVAMQVLKYRDGDSDLSFRLYEDFATSFLASLP